MSDLFFSHVMSEITKHQSSLTMPTTTSGCGPTSGPEFRLRSPFPLPTKMERKQPKKLQFQNDAKTVDLGTNYRYTLQVNNLQINILIDHDLDLFVGDLTCVLVT